MSLRLHASVPNAFAAEAETPAVDRNRLPVRRRSTPYAVQFELIQLHALLPASAHVRQLTSHVVPRLPRPGAQRSHATSPAGAYGTSVRQAHATGCAVCARAERKRDGFHASETISEFRWQLPGALYCRLWVKHADGFEGGQGAVDVKLAIDRREGVSVGRLGQAQSPCGPDVRLGAP